MIRKAWTHTARGRAIAALALSRIFVLWITVDNVSMLIGLALITRGVQLRWSGALALIVCGALLLALTLLRTFTDGRS